MGLLDRWDRRNQRIAEEHNDISWEEFGREPDNRYLRAYWRYRVVSMIVCCFIFLIVVVIWLGGEILEGP